MINMIQNAKDQAAALAMNAYKAAVADGSLPEAEVKTAPVEIPKDTANGDFTTTFALAASKALRQPPRNIAQALLDHMELEGTYFTSAQIAGPGFLNFRLNDSWFRGVMEAVETEGEAYGTNDTLKGKKYMVEFVSANPTGPMHMGNARGGVLGDTLANVLARDGWDTWKEFYVNDAGNQINKFAVSINARYMQLILGEENFQFPEEGYHGDDIRALAQAIYQAHGDSWKDLPEEERFERMAEYIKTQPNSEKQLITFAAVQRIAEKKGSKYPLTKKWFLNAYPEYKANEVSANETAELEKQLEAQLNAQLDALMDDDTDDTLVEFPNVANL